MSPAVPQALWSPDDCGVVFVGWWHEPFRLGLSACSNRRWVPPAPSSVPARPGVSSAGGLQPDPRLLRRSGIFHLDLASGHCSEHRGRGGARVLGVRPQGAELLPPAELLSAERGAACSPRLSPDGRRLLYLEGGLGGPHRQCLRLRMVSGALRALGTAPPGMSQPPAAAGQGRAWAWPPVPLPQFP